MCCLVEEIRNYQIEEKASEWLKNHQKMIFLNVIFGIMLYFMMIAGNLVNSYDGIWNTSYFDAGSWEASLGRGLLHYVDKVRAGIISMPFNTILTVLIIFITSSLILDLFVEGNRGLGVLASLLLIANPVICVTLSYCYTSVGYAMSLGCYQAYVGFTCFLL